MQWWGLFKEARGLSILPPLHVAPTRYKPSIDLIKPGFPMARQFHGLTNFAGKIGVHFERG